MPHSEPGDDRHFGLVENAVNTLLGAFAISGRMGSDSP